jgi:hypothetical protein
VNRPSRAKLSVGGVARGVIRAYRRHWALLILAAIVILLPQALVDAVLDQLQVEGVESAKDAAVLAAVPLTVAVSLLGQAAYAGFAAAAVIESRAGHPVPRMVALIRSLPLKRLVAVDLILGVGAAVGLVMLVVPGLVFLAVFSIAPAVIKIEHLPVWASLHRCVELVRGQFWRVGALVVGTIFVIEWVVQALTYPFHGLGAAVVADLAVEGVLEPIEGLVLVLVTMTLLELRGELPAGDALALAPVERKRNGPPP